MTPKSAHASHVTLAVLMQPTEANIHGNIHGGVVMKLMDDAGAAAAIRHAQRPVVTVAVDQVTFREPIHVGDLVTLEAILTYTGRSSMEVQINVTAQNLITSEKTHTNTAYFVYVALDEAGRPAPVPPLQLDSDDDRARWQAAQERQAYRLAQRQRSA